MVIRLSDYYSKVMDKPEKIKSAIELVDKEYKILNAFEVKGEMYFQVENKEIKSASSKRKTA